MLSPPKNRRCMLDCYLQKNEHSHPQDEQETERQHIWYRAKKKAAEDTFVRPSKIIQSEIQVFGEEAFQPNDLKCISKSVYRVRRKTYPPLPKSREGVHQAIFVLANGRGINSQVYR